MSILALDLDGTLVNSANQIHRSLASASKELFGLEISSDLILENLGLPFTSILEKTSIPQDSYGEVVTLFRENLEKEIIAGNELFDGVIDFLIVAKKMRFKLVIATSKPTYLAKLVVKESELFDYIDFVQGTDGFSPKPDPEIIFRIKKEVAGSVIALVGDRTEDMRAAKNASIKGVGVAQSAHSLEVLAAAGADYTCMSIADLLASSILHDLSANRR
jgi:phosphoglycolate phosphatase